mgnify:CR=1 FL=1
MLINIVTGLVAGAIHVVGGVDHLASMTPVALQQPRIALRTGLSWGLGHSAGVLLLSMLAVLVKDLAHIERISSVAEFSVGIVLLVVGTLAIRTSLGLNIHTHSHNHSGGHAHDHIHLHFRGSKKHTRHAHAATGLGILHGFAGASHFLAVLPALALPPLAAVAYMAAYLLGSIATMGAFLMAISLATMRVGRKALPLIVGFAGSFSVLTGLFWIQKTSGQII